MHTKFVIFVIIGTLLVATMHSSSTLFVFAELLTSCENLNETKAHCTVTHVESYHLGSDCTKNMDGTYSCTQDQDEDQDVTNPPKVTDKDAIHLGSDCTKNMDGTYSCTQDEFLKEDETNDDYNSSAKTPNTGGPVPIPYPNTNN